MFGRRRRSPLLTAAVLAGTATVASRHGARKQTEAEAQRQWQMEQEEEFRRNKDERERERNQRAIDLAVTDALAKQSQQGSPAPVIVQPAAGPPPVYMAPDDYAPGGPYLHPDAVPPRPRSVSAVDNGVCFCTGCGNQCGLQDKFCSRCGNSMAGGQYSQPSKQNM
jgi:hypothetical protein